MLVEDRIYEKFEIADPVILELIATRPFQRLKRINQYGGVDLVFPGRYGVTRYEHSLGVWRVLQSLGAAREIQVAGLLHDIGHTAFSHMVDMAMAGSAEDYHEKNMRLIEGMGEIDSVLRRHRLRLLNADDCPEIKRSLPDVGADRVDYGVRDYVGAVNSGSELGERVLAGIELAGREIVFTDPSTAGDYALTGLEAMWLCIYEPSVACVYQALTEIIRTGIGEGWIQEEDLFGDDTSLFSIIESNRERIPETHFKLFTTPFTVEEVPEAEADFNHIKLKVRYFDPPVRVGDRMERVSALNPEFLEKLEPMKAKFEARKKGAFFKVIFAES